MEDGIVTVSDLRCIGKRCDDGPPLDDHPGPRMARRGLLCGRCAGRLERHLAEMPARVTLLRAVFEPGRGGGEGRSRQQWPVPLDLEAHDHLSHLSAVVGSWTVMVAEEREMRGPDHPGDPVAASRWLLSQVEWLTGQPWVDDLADELRDLAMRADGIVRFWPQTHRLDPPCPECSAHELARRDGESRVVCGSCGASWDESAYRLLVLVLASDPDVTMSAQDAARRLGVTVGTLRNMVTAKLIRKVQTVGGRARYATDDVDRLMRDGAA